MKTIVLILISVLVTFFFRGKLYYKMAVIEASYSEGTDLAITKSMQKYGYCLDGDINKDPSVWEIIKIGLTI